MPLGKELKNIDELGAGDIGAIAKLKETRAGDVLCAKQTDIAFPALDLPAPVMAFAFEPKTKGDDEKAVTAIRRLEEEDPTLDVHRDQQTGQRTRQHPLGVREQQPGHSDLDHGEQEQPAPAAGHVHQPALRKGERQEDEAADRRPRENERSGVDVAHGHPNEQIRHAPNHAHGREQRPAPPCHPAPPVGSTAR